MKDPSEIMLSRLRRMRPADAQNALMRLSDREAALCMKFMDENDRAYVLSFMARSKAARVRDECSLQTRLHITYDQYRRTVTSVLRRLSGSREQTSDSYLRPRRR